MKLKVVMANSVKAKIKGLEDPNKPFDLEEIEPEKVREELKSVIEEAKKLEPDDADLIQKGQKIYFIMKNKKGDKLAVGIFYLIWLFEVMEE